MPRQVSPEKRKQRYEQVRTAIWCLTGSMPRYTAEGWQANGLAVHHACTLQDALKSMLAWLDVFHTEGEP